MPGEKIYRSYSLSDEFAGSTKKESEPSGSDILEPADKSPLALYIDYLRGLIRKNRLSATIVVTGIKARVGHSAGNVIVDTKETVGQ